MARSASEGPKDRWTPHALKILERARKNGIPTFEKARSDYERDVLRLAELQMVHVRSERREIRHKTIEVDSWRTTSQGENALRCGTVDPEKITRPQSIYRKDRQASRKRIKDMQRSESHARTLISKTVSTVGLSVAHATEWMTPQELMTTAIGKIMQRVDNHIAANLGQHREFVLGKVHEGGEIGFSSVEMLVAPTKTFKRFLHDIPAVGQVQDTCSVISLSRYDGGALLVTLGSYVEYTDEERDRLGYYLTMTQKQGKLHQRGLFLTSSETMAAYLMMELR